MPSASHARGTPRSAISTRPACATPVGRTSPSFGSPNVTVRPARTTGPAGGLAVGGQPRGQVQAQTGRPAALMASIAAATGPGSRAARAGPQQGVDDDVGVPELRGHAPEGGPRRPPGPRRRTRRRAGGRPGSPARPPGPRRPVPRPSGDAGAAPEQVARDDEAVAAVAPLPAHDGDAPAADRAQRALERVGGPAPSVLHEDEARHAVALRSRAGRLGASPRRWPAGSRRALRRVPRFGGSRPSPSARTCATASPASWVRET